MSVLLTFDVEDSQITILRKQPGTVPRAFVIDTDAVTQLDSSLVNTFTTFPTLIALLRLIVSGLVISNKEEA